MIKSFEKYFESVKEENIQIGDNVYFKNGLYPGAHKVVDKGKEKSGFKGGFLVDAKGYKVGARSSELTKVKPTKKTNESTEVISKMTKELAKEMFEYLDSMGEHKLVSKYKGVVTDNDISGVIQAWGTSIKPLDDIIEDYWILHTKLYKVSENYSILFEAIERDIHLTLDNGGIPFVADIHGKSVSVYQKKLCYENVVKVFTGDDKGGDTDATMVLKMGPNKYVYVGSGDIYEFVTEDEIKEFSSPIGNSAVPYPFAIGNQYVYFMLDRVFVDKKAFETKKDLYSEFYSKKDTLEIHKMKEMKEIVKRKV